MLPQKSGTHGQNSVPNGTKPRKKELYFNLNKIIHWGQSGTVKQKVPNRDGEPVRKRQRSLRPLRTTAVRQPSLQQAEGDFECLCIDIYGMANGLSNEIGLTVCCLIPQGFPEGPWHCFPRQ
jgi:hypothetical protein